MGFARGSWHTLLAHDPDYVPEPIYPEYIPLEDEHEFLAEEQPLPPVDSPTAESPDNVTTVNLEGIQEESRMLRRDGWLMKDDRTRRRGEHLAPGRLLLLITVRPQASISLPPEAEVERLLAMTTPSPSPPISLSPPSVGERLVRSMAPPAHASPPPVPSPLLPSSRCPTQIQTLRIASTQALIDAVTATLPSPPLPPLPPSLYIPPPVDCRDDIPESEQPPRKRLYLSTLGSRYEVGESSTARPTRGRGIDYGFVSTVDAEERRQGTRDVGYGIRDTWVDPAEAVPEIAPMTVGEVNTRVTELAEFHEHDTQYGLCRRRPMLPKRLGLTHGDRVSRLIRSFRPIVHETRSQMQQAKLAALQETDRRRQAQMVETLRVIRNMRREMSDMQAELLVLREQQRRAR
ncbi:hypothetical protein Tco_0576808 [Tanacetum coccineum]